MLFLFIFLLLIICPCLMGAGALACIGCLQGTFAAGNGSTACLACSLGSFSVSAAATDCTSCWTEETGPCRSVTSRICTPCKSLRFSADPLMIPGKYLCRYGKSSQALEFECNIPNPGFEQKLNCDYEDSLSCKLQENPGSDSIQLDCQP
jgi:hypothetical protein